MSLTIALDFDGTIVKPFLPLQFRAGAREAILAMAEAGHRLLLFSARSRMLDDSGDPVAESAEFFRTGRPPRGAVGRWDRQAEMRNFLQMAGVAHVLEEWTGPGKPHADVFLDDRAEVPDWQEVRESFGSGVTSKP